MPTRKTARRQTVSPGISRIDQDSTRTHGFVVRLGYSRTASGGWRPRHQAFFGDATHGGKRGALRAAEAWREGALRSERKRGGARTRRATGTAGRR